MTTRRSKLSPVPSIYDIKTFMRHGKISDGIFVDVGSAYGSWSVRTHQMSCFKEIHAIEPQHLPEHDLLNTDIQLHHFVIGERNEMVTFYSYKINPRISSVLPPEKREKQLGFNRGPYTILEVESRTLDSFNFVGDCFIKIDTEGYENSVLRGAKNTLSNNNCVVVMEVCDENPLETFSIMKDYGYEVFGYMFMEKMQCLPSSNVQFHTNEHGTTCWTCDNLVVDYEKLVKPSKILRSPKFDSSKEHPMWSDFIFKKSTQ